MKKHHTYETVMIDHKTRNIISMINSRDMGEVSDWLKTFPNLKIVTRDGSIIYKNSIEIANKDIIQITDRFHLIKGLSEVLNEYIRHNIPKIVIIDKIESDLKLKTLKEKFIATKKAIESGSSFTNACKENDMNYRTMKKLIELNELELNKYFEDKQTKIKLEKIEKKNELVFHVQELFKSGVSIREISRQNDIDRRTVRKYIQPGFKFSLDSTSRERTNSCTKYEDIIIEMIKQKSTIKNIYQKISDMGYKGKYGMVKSFVSKIKENDTLLIEEKLTRKQVIKLLYKPLTKIKKLNKEKLRRLYKIYPIVKTLVELMHVFKGILLNTKKQVALEKWIEKAKKLGIDALNTFIKGLNLDYPAVLNSMQYQESNGLIEASVHRIKKVKRIMHGRCGFELLKSKVLLCEL